MKITGNKQDIHENKREYTGYPENHREKTGYP
jgi:hypothetical protein